MGLFTRMYDSCLRWARHRHAPYYLTGLSFAESSFFPIPPDVMLMPMSLAQPRRAMYFASITTLASVAGGILGYAIGYFALDWVAPLIQEGGRWSAAYNTAISMVCRLGFLGGTDCRIFAHSLQGVHNFGRRIVDGFCAVCDCIGCRPRRAFFSGRRAAGMGWAHYGSAYSCLCRTNWLGTGRTGCYRLYCNQGLKPFVT